jgi:hypothetical protein
MLKNFRAGTREHMIISNATIDNSLEFLKRIKNNFQFNELLRGLFGDYIPTDVENHASKWVKEEIDILGNRILTGSAEGNLVSRHYKIMVHDDLVNRDNSAKAEQIEKVVDWWRLAQSLILHDGIEIIIGTRWHFDDLYGHLIEKFLKPPKGWYEGKPIAEFHRGRYHILQMDCWEDPEKETGSTFPVLFPEWRLKEIQAEQGERFNGQYRNDPLAKGTNPFKLEWLRNRWRKSDLPSIRYTLMLIDPSGKAKVDSDWTGITLIHLCPDKKGYIEVGERQLITDMKLAEYIIDSAMQYRPDMVCIEDNKFQVIADMLEFMIPQYIKQGKIPEEHKDYMKTLPYILCELQPHGRAGFVI